MFRFALLAAVVLPSILPVPLSGDEIRLKDGRTVEGEITSAPGASEVTIVAHAGGMDATLHFKANEIAKTTYGDTPNQVKFKAFIAKRTKAEKDPTTSAAALWTLAEEARVLGETAAVRPLAKAVIAKDPDHAQARQVLGFVKQDGKWMKPAEAALARGEVLFRNQWMPPAQRDAILAEEKRAAAEAEAKAAKEREAKIANAAVAEARAKAEKAQAEADAANAPYATFGTGYVVPSNVVLVPGCTTTTTTTGTSSGIRVHAQGGGSSSSWSVDMNQTTP
jgi:membrane protein involved in colicin uptake